MPVPWGRPWRRLVRFRCIWRCEDGLEEKGNVFEIEPHPVGQQAGLLLLSRAHDCPSWQQKPLNCAPRSSAHSNVFDGQASALPKRICVAADPYVAVAVASAMKPAADRM